MSGVWSSAVTARDGFTLLPNVLFRRSQELGLDHADLVVLLDLITYAFPRQGLSCIKVSEARISAETRLCLRKVRSTILALEARKFLTVSRAKNCVSEYSLLLLQGKLEATPEPSEVKAAIALAFADPADPASPAESEPVAVSQEEKIAVVEIKNKETSSRVAQAQEALRIATQNCEDRLASPELDDVPVELILASGETKSATRKEAEACARIEFQQEVDLKRSLLASPDLSAQDRDQLMADLNRIEHDIQNAYRLALYRLKEEAQFELTAAQSEEDDRSHEERKASVEEMKEADRLAKLSKLGGAVRGSSPCVQLIKMGIDPMTKKPIEEATDEDEVEQ